MSFYFRVESYISLDILRNIKLLVIDLDGVISDGRLIISQDLKESKTISYRDGLGIKLINSIGIKVSVITSGCSHYLLDRLNYLGVKDFFDSQANKIPAFNKLQKKYCLTDKQVAYMGDDLPDLHFLERVGFSAAPSDAIEVVKHDASYICRNRGGFGAIREVCDLLLRSRKCYKNIVQNYKKYGAIKK